MSINGPTGEAPQLSSAYAKYDNGINVFNEYWNFAGNSTPNGVSLGDGFYVDNGLMVNLGSSGYETTFSLPSSYPFIFDVFNSEINASSGWYSNAWCFISGGGSRLGGTGYWSGGEASGPSISEIPTVFSITDTSSQTIDPTWNYANSQSGVPGFSPSSTGASGFDSIFASAGNGDSLQSVWSYARVRSYPPNGVMPSVKFDAITN